MAQANALGLNIGAIILGFLGIAVQGQLERWRETRYWRQRENALAALSEAERTHIQRMPRRSWLGLFFGADERERERQRRWDKNQPWRRSA